MKPVVFEEVSKIWNTISVGNKTNDIDVELEIPKKLLNIFQVGDYYYYIFNLKNLEMEFMSKEMETVLGYKASEMDLTSLFNKIHPEDQPWFLTLETKQLSFCLNFLLNKFPIIKFGTTTE